MTAPATNKKKLNQIVAVRKSITSRVLQEATEVYQTLKKPDLFNGHSRKYHVQNEGGENSETFPDENQKVQFNVEERLKRLASLESEVYDVELTADTANGSAKADIIVEGKTLGTDVPATTLIFLEKKLGEIRNCIQIAPELATDEDWTLDANSSLHKTEPRKTNRTKKLQKALVLYPHSDKHPAQTQLISEDVVVGLWELVKHSGGISKPRKDVLLHRIGKLIDSVKTARELANMQEVEERKLGGPLFEYLLA